jgi:hypothetical protein
VRKYVENSKKPRIQDLNVAINTHGRLTTQLEEEERPAYIKADMKKNGNEAIAVKDPKGKY